MNSSDQQARERDGIKEARKHRSLPRATRTLWPEEPLSTIAYSSSISVGQLGAHWVTHCKPPQMVLSYDASCLPLNKGSKHKGKAAPQAL